MTAHKKLMEARIRLQGMELKKSGLNKFAGYSYFELGDFLPSIQAIFNQIGLCGVVSYTAEYATLTITDVDDGTVIVVTSPMAEAQLKGTHPIQNLGAVETYQRRYLWMTAMEIVEHDILDSTTGYEDPKQKAPVRQEPAKKPAAEPPKKPAPAHVEGKGNWMIKIETDEGSSFDAWVDLVIDAVNTTLSFAKSQADVMAVFRDNKATFDKVKDGSPEGYDTLLSVFKKAKESHQKD